MGDGESAVAAFEHGSLIEPVILPVCGSASLLSAVGLLSGEIVAVSYTHLGRLRRYAPHESGEAARYQHSPCTQSHLHIRCVDCGALAHLHCDEVEAFARHLGQHHGFTLDESQTVLYGLCEACRKKHAK